MSVAQRHVAQQYAGRGGPSGLADVLEVLLDKGLVIDAYVRVSLVGIELLTVDVRVVVASVDTYLRFAEAVNRLDLTQASNAQTLGDLVSGNGSDQRRSSIAASGDGRSNGAGSNGTERSDRSARSAEDTESAEADETAEADDGPGILTRIKERGQAF